MIGTLVRCTALSTLFLTETVDLLLDGTDGQRPSYANQGDYAVVIDFEDIAQTRQWETGFTKRQLHAICVLGHWGVGWSFVHHWEQA